MTPSRHGWQFWIDRGGTFTDVVARDPDGHIHVHKLLSDNPDQYEDAPLHAIRMLMDLERDAAIPATEIHSVNMGTTLATNALLERKGVPVGLMVTKGFRDLLEIGYQDRPDLFALEIRKPESLAEAVVEVDERVLADGTVRQALDEDAVREALGSLRSRGIDALGVLLLHSFSYPEHEIAVGRIAREMGFSQVSLSHEVACEIKAVGRGDTTMVDAYLTPIIRGYVARTREALGPDVPLHFMQSNGGLAHADRFSGKDAILSGPAGGVIAYQHIGARAGLAKCIGFDMGGTSTDVSRVDGAPEYVYEKVVAGVRLKAPMIRIETVAAGGGSILQFDGRRFTVGPESAGAYPGPACYRNGGPATVTDANLVLGRIQPDFFPECFGAKGDQPLDADASRARLGEIVGRVTEATGRPHSIEEVAAGFVRIANANMVKPIKEISVVRGYDVQEYALACFGGAGPQHACAIASELGIRDVLIHPYAGVLSAYGMGLADITHTAVETILRPLDEETLEDLELRFREFEAEGEAVLRDEGVLPFVVPPFPGSGNHEDVMEVLHLPWPVRRTCGLRYAGTDAVLEMCPELERADAEWCEEYQTDLEKQRLATMKELEESVGGPLCPETRNVLTRPAQKNESLTTHLTLSYGMGADFLRRKFEHRHRALYGFVKEGHPIEVVDIRVATFGKAPQPEQGNEGTSPAPLKDMAPDELLKRLAEKGWTGDLEAASPVFERGAPLERAYTLSKAMQDPSGLLLDDAPRPVSPDTARASAPVHFDILRPDGTREVAALDTPVFMRADLKPFNFGDGPAIIIDKASTIVVDPGWAFGVDDSGNLFLSAEEPSARQEKVSTECDPVMLEVFDNLFMSVADQMGEVLERVSHSVNIKERRDFSCALFTASGELVANAHHIPVHLGAMSESVRAVIEARGDAMRPGDAYVTNNPYHGGSHLPDVTVVTPVFAPSSGLAFFAANRGHHADIGGITPGSMPPESRTVEEEGVVLDNLLLVRDGALREEEVVRALSSGPYPARNVSERLSDLRAQIAANAAGVRLLDGLCDKYSLDTSQAYMGHVRANAAAAMREMIATLPDGAHRAEDRLDNGARIACTITIDGDRAVVDFSGTDPQLEGNLNAPPAVTLAAVLYVFRTLIGRPIPLNGGCMDPIDIRIPEGCLLNPRWPAAVAGGNVETSMRVVDVLYSALGVLAGSQGTMNNLSFGTADWGYYETICGGAGAGHGFHGASAVHTHMTNTRITDPEVLERRYPVVLREFAVRRGSGGQGAWHGGDGAVRVIEALEPMFATLLSERRVLKPNGLRGGRPGASGHNTLMRDGRSSALPGHFSVELRPGDVVVIKTPGGGGFGDAALGASESGPAEAGTTYSGST